MASKRIGKRSILGTKVAILGSEGKFYSGVIQNTSSFHLKDEENEQSEINYFIRLDDTMKLVECTADKIVGQGFRTINSITLRTGQKVYITHNSRETIAFVKCYNSNSDEVVVILKQENSPDVEVSKKMDEIRLWESRKSARLVDYQDQNFAKLAEVGQHRKSTISIAVPKIQTGSRKRRTSYGSDGDVMDDCMAAMVLMSLSCSPKSPRYCKEDFVHGSYYVTSSENSMASSWSSNANRSNTPSPPLSDSNYYEANLNSRISQEEITFSEDINDVANNNIIFKNPTKTLYQCTWPGCGVVTTSCSSIEKHVRINHLRNDQKYILGDHEEEFYYKEVEINIDRSIEHYAGRQDAFTFPSCYTVLLSESSPPTLSHMDMVRPPHENPNFHIQMKNTSNRGKQATKNLQILKPAQRSLKITARKPRSDIKKCRKIYGIENKEMWCTQCKWKKACSRFSTTVI